MLGHCDAAIRSAWFLILTTTTYPAHRLQRCSPSFRSPFFLFSSSFLTLSRTTRRHATSRIQAFVSELFSIPLTVTKRPGATLELASPKDVVSTNSLLDGRQISICHPGVVRDNSVQTRRASAWTNYRSEVLVSLTEMVSTGVHMLNMGSKLLLSRRVPGPSQLCRVEGHQRSWSQRKWFNLSELRLHVRPIRPMDLVH